jgi:hypothetical protein
MTPLTIVYHTHRRHPRFDWFLDSLHNECQNYYQGIQLVIVDFFEREHAFEKHYISEKTAHRDLDWVWSPPMPSVWNGPHRLTKEDYFAACASRNAGICLAKHDWIAFVDDLSVLVPGWLANVRQSQAFNGVTLGAYKKVKKLVVKDGVIVSYDHSPGGVDSRWKLGSDKGAVPIDGQYMFGCSMLAPTEAFLSVNGFPAALCDGMGFEDVITGIALQNRGWNFRYNRNMCTLESEEAHGEEKAFRRDDQGTPGPDDKSHRVLNQVRNGLNWFDNCFGDGGLRRIREDVLAGKPFPVINNPQHEWFTGKHLSEL